MITKQELQTIAVKAYELGKVEQYKERGRILSDVDFEGVIIDTEGDLSVRYDDGDDIDSFFIKLEDLSLSDTEIKNLQEAALDEYQERMNRNRTENEQRKTENRRKQWEELNKEFGKNA